MAGVDEVPSEQSAPAAELDYQPVAFPNRPEQLDHARRAVVRVKPEPQVVHEREVGPVIRLVGLRHAAIVAASREDRDSMSVQARCQIAPVPGVLAVGLSQHLDQHRP